MSWGNTARPSWWKALDCETQEERFLLAQRVAQRVEIMRIGKDMTKQQMGYMLHSHSSVGQKMYNQLLRGKRILTRQQLYKFADEFDVDTSDLVANECPLSIYKYTTYANSPAQFKALNDVMREKMHRSMANLKKSPIDVWQLCGFKRYSMLLGCLRGDRRLQKHEFLGLCAYFMYDEQKILMEAGIMPKKLASCRRRQDEGSENQE